MDLRTMVDLESIVPLPSILAHLPWHAQVPVIPWKAAVSAAPGLGISGLALSSARTSGTRTRVDAATAVRMSRCMAFLPCLLGCGAGLPRPRCSEERLCGERRPRKGPGPARRGGPSARGRVLVQLSLQGLPVQPETPRGLRD